MASAVEFQNINKVFYSNHNLQACKDINLDVQEGEILCIAGENGAGKSTLMDILDGLISPTSGIIKIHGEKVEIKSPLQAIRHKIGMVHQHFMLFEDFTVSENVTMTQEPRKHKFFYDREKADNLVQIIIDKYGFSIKASDRVKSLTTGEKQQTEIIKLLYMNADLLILDEPTSVLTVQEIDSLFENLRQLKNIGKTIILITHKLKEIKRISDRVAIMKNGEMIGVFNTSSLSESEIASLMFDGGVTFSAEKKQNTFEDIGPVISFKNVTVQRITYPSPSLDKLSFGCQRGEILGFAGVSGNGLGYIEGVLSGIIRVNHGHIIHNKLDITHMDVKGRREDGLCFVPSDRLGTGSAGSLSVKENLIVDRLVDFTKHGMIDSEKADAFYDSSAKMYGISGDKDDCLSSLSGGNIQKTILAREIAGVRDYIVFSEPTWGLDISSSQVIYNNIQKLRNRGIAIILISSNLEEVLQLSDRIIIICKGRVVKSFKNDGTVSKRDIGNYMLGQKDDFKGGYSAEN